MNRPVHNETLTVCLRSAITEGEAGLSSVPGLLKRVIHEQAWRERLIPQTGELVTFERFSDFVETPPLEGLGADLKALQRLCADDDEASGLLRSIAAGEVLPLPANGEIGNGRSRLDNVKPTRGGNDPDYLTRRIARDAPEILERMKAGEFPSVRAAAKAAGIVRDPTQLEILKKAWRKADADERARFLEWTQAME